jgi:hypothetical protein
MDDKDRNKFIALLGGSLETYASCLHYDDESFSSSYSNQESELF